MHVLKRPDHNTPSASTQIIEWLQDPTSDALVIPAEILSIVVLEDVDRCVEKFALTRNKVAGVFYLEPTPETNAMLAKAGIAMGLVPELAAYVEEKAKMNLRGRLNQWLGTQSNEFTFTEEELHALEPDDIVYVLSTIDQSYLKLGFANGLHTITRRFPFEEKGKVAPSPITHDTRIYSHERYHELVAETVKQLEELGRLKGGEYAGDTDRLANFRRNAERMGVNMETVWGVYTAKHWDAIMQFVTDLNTGKTRARLESLAGRADDIIVYMVLFKAILEEREKGMTDVS